MINYKGRLFSMMQKYVSANVSFRSFHDCAMFYFAQTNHTFLPNKTPYFHCVQYNIIRFCLIRVLFSDICIKVNFIHVVVVNLISDRQYQNKNKLLSKQNTTLLIAVQCHQRSPWAHRAGGLQVLMFIREPGAEQVRLEIIRHNGR